MNRIIYTLLLSLVFSGIAQAQKLTTVSGKDGASVTLTKGFHESNMRGKASRYEATWTEPKRAWALQMRYNDHSKRRKTSPKEEFQKSYKAYKKEHKAVRLKKAGVIGAYRIRSGKMVTYTIYTDKGVYHLEFMALDGLDKAANSRAAKIFSSFRPGKKK